MSSKRMPKNMGSPGKGSHHAKGGHQNHQVARVAQPPPAPKQSDSIDSSPDDGKRHDSKPQCFANQFRKTRMCKFFLLNKCTRGKSCSHAHDENEIRFAPDLTKTSMCRQLLDKGVCDNHNCKYAHRLSELKSTNTFFKTRVCRFFQETGQCKLGSKCRYAHHDFEVREETRKAEPGYDLQERHNNLIDSHIDDSGSVQGAQAPHGSPSPIPPPPFKPPWHPGVDLPYMSSPSGYASLGPSPGESDGKAGYGKGFSLEKNAYGKGYPYGYGQPIPGYPPYGQSQMDYYAGMMKGAMMAKGMGKGDIYPPAKGPDPYASSKGDPSYKGDPYMASTKGKGDPFASSKGSDHFHPGKGSDPFQSFKDWNGYNPEVGRSNTWQDAHPKPDQRRFESHNSGPAGQGMFDWIGGKGWDWNAKPSRPSQPPHSSFSNSVPKSMQPDKLELTLDAQLYEERDQFATKNEMFVKNTFLEMSPQTNPEKSGLRRVAMSAPHDLWKLADEVDNFGLDQPHPRSSTMEFIPGLDGFDERQAIIGNPFESLAGDVEVIQQVITEDEPVEFELKHEAYNLPRNSTGYSVSKTFIEVDEQKEQSSTLPRAAWSSPDFQEMIGLGKTWGSSGSLLNADWGSKPGHWQPGQKLPPC